MRTLTVGICPEGRISYMSGQGPAAKTAAIPASQWVGKPCWCDADDSQKPKIRSAFAEALLTGEPSRIDIDTVVGGIHERWRVIYRKASLPIAVMAHGYVLAERDDRCLTHRERQIVQLMIGDCTVEQMAQLLKISESTVTTHQQNVREKTGCQTNAGVAVWGVRAGLQPSVG